MRARFRRSRDRPNEQDVINLRANGTAKVASNADLQVSIRLRQQ